MADSSQADALAGRTVALAGEPGALKAQAAACLDALGARSVSLELNGDPGPTVDDVKDEGRVAAALDRVVASLADADAIVYVGRDLRQGERMAEFLEEAIGGYHFYLKLAKRLRESASTDVVALATASADGGQSALAADIRNGSLRQLSMVAASEGGPMDPPLRVNAVYVSGEPQTGASASLTALLSRLLGRPQGYVTGTTLRVGL